MSEKKNDYQRLINRMLDSPPIAIACVAVAVLAAVIGLTDLVMKPYHAWLKWQSEGEPLKVAVTSFERRDQTLMISDRDENLQSDHFRGVDSCVNSTASRAMQLNTNSLLRDWHFDPHWTCRGLMPFL